MTKQRPRKRTGSTKGEAHGPDLPAVPRNDLRATYRSQSPTSESAGAPPRDFVADGTWSPLSVRPTPVDIPSAEAQIRFLSNVQALLEGGLFSATYKYALLLALADLAVEKGRDDASALELRVEDIAGKFVEYYWEHCRPFIGASGSRRKQLLQNAGTQAKILSLLSDAHERSGGKLAALKRDAPAARALRRNVASVVRQMPLWKLQTIGRETRDFLYPNVARGAVITLRPDVGFCLRRFHDLLTNLVRGAWVDWVRRQNRDAIGDVADLEEFLFGTQRRRLRELAPVLHDMQEGRCFYTARRIDKPTTGEVDHFVPFARFPHDFGHNLVLASKEANACKSDRLAAEPHLERWCRRNQDAGDVLAREAVAAGLAADLERTIAVARWAYSQASSTRTPVWARGREADVALTGAWARLLAERGSVCVT